jgi:hypothetical protein
MEQVRCPFEKAILSAQCGCENSTRQVVAERMNAGCRSPVAAQRCHQWLGLVKERSRFTLKITDASGVLPFGKQMKVVVGGLLGLQRIVEPSADISHVANVHALLDRACTRFGSIEALPFQEIVRSVQTYEPRRRRSET